MKTLAAIVAASLIILSGAYAHEKQGHAPGPGLFGQPPEYVHLLLNPLPVYGIAIGLLALGAALLARSKPARTLAIVVIVVCAASAWPVQYFGENAYQRVRQISDEQGQQSLDQHMERAGKLIYVFYATALLGIAALVSQMKFPKAATPLAVVILIAAAASLGAGAWISKVGGEIRHPELRGMAGAQPPAEHTQPSQQLTSEEKK